MRTSGAVLVLTLLCNPGLWAQAGGFGFYEVSTPNAGEAYAGQAAIATDAPTSFLNPAGMTSLNGRHVLIGGQLVDLSMRFTQSGGSAGQAKSDSLNLVPGFYFV